MPDFTASTALRDIIGDHLAADFYFMTLHDGTGGFVAGDVYSAGVRGELTTALGYTQGGEAVTLVNTAGVLDGADAVWTATGGSLVASYAALWINTTDTVTGAELVYTNDSSGSPQTATDGNNMTVTIVNPITIPTPA